MKVRKSLFAVWIVGILFAGSYAADRASQKAVRAPRLAADGADPLPRPRPMLGPAAADPATPGVLLADGSDPMPAPRPPRKLA